MTPLIKEKSEYTNKSEYENIGKSSLYYDQSVSEEA